MKKITEKITGIAFYNREISREWVVLNKAEKVVQNSLEDYLYNVVDEAEDDSYREGGRLSTYKDCSDGKEGDKEYILLKYKWSDEEFDRQLEAGNIELVHMSEIYALSLRQSMTGDTVIEFDDFIEQLQVVQKSRKRIHELHKTLETYTL